MAGIAFTITSPATTMAASTALTHLKVTAASNIRDLIKKIEVSSNSITPTDGGILVELGVCTGGTMTGSVTPRKCDSTHDETLQVTAGYQATGEPTYSYILWSAYFPAQGGDVWTFDPPMPIPGGTIVCVRLTPAGLAATTKAVVSLHGEE